MAYLNFLKYSVEFMPSKASKTSKRDLKTSLPIKISATDFRIGFINLVSMLSIILQGYIKLLVKTDKYAA